MYTYILYADKLSSCPTEGYILALYAKHWFSSLYIMYGQIVISQYTVDQHRVWRYTGNTIYREMKSIPISIIVNTGYRHSSYLHFSVARGGHKAILYVNTEVNIYIYTFWSTYVVPAYLYIYTFNQLLDTSYDLWDISSHKFK